MNEQSLIQKACDVLADGGVIAYPTEQCFGLGCDPDNEDAVQRILDIKQRKAEQGVILIGLDQQQLAAYANFSSLDAAQLNTIEDSWPGPNTWLVPAYPAVSRMLRGRHASIAVRATANGVCRSLLTQFGKPIVSTSANRHGQSSLIEAQDVVSELGTDVDFVLELAVGGASKPSPIRDALTGQQIR